MGSALFRLLAPEITTLAPVLTILKRNPPTMRAGGEPLLVLRGVGVVKALRLALSGVSNRPPLAPLDWAPTPLRSTSLRELSLSASGGLSRDYCEILTPPLTPLLATWCIPRLGGCQTATTWFSWLPATAGIVRILPLPPSLSAERGFTCLSDCEKSSVRRFSSHWGGVGGGVVDRASESLLRAF